jgi:hypothetical protein
VNKQDYTTTISVDQPPRQVFDAIKNIRGWWSENIEGSTDELGNEFIYRYKDAHQCKLRLTELVPDERVAWLIVDNYFNFTRDKSEWSNTKIVFEIAKKSNKTEIRFTHLGLVPDYECFDICSDAWNSYIVGSLRSLIVTGKGRPNAKEARRGRAGKS